MKQIDKRLLLVLARMLAIGVCFFHLPADALEISCNLKARTLVLGSGFPEEPGSLKQTIDWEKLSVIVIASNDQRLERRGRSKIARRQCGPFSVFVSAGFLNSSPMGELGAVDFPSAWVRNGSQELFRVNFYACEKNIPRFDPCPGGYADLVYLNWSKDVDVSSVRFERTFSDDAGEKTVEHRDVMRLVKRK